MKLKYGVFYFILFSILLIVMTNDKITEWLATLDENTRGVLLLIGNTTLAVLTVMCIVHLVVYIYKTIRDES